MRNGFFADCPLTRLSRDFDLFASESISVDPALTAELDQHAAAVRDSILTDRVDITRRSLTHYLQGFIDGCRERGWDSSSVEYDWETLRVLAICRMAKEYGFVR